MVVSLVLGAAPLPGWTDYDEDEIPFEIPEEFTALDEGEGFKFEILVTEASGNQMAVESCFEVEQREEIGRRSPRSPEGGTGG